MKKFTLFFLIFTIYFFNAFAEIKVITTIKPLADIFKEVGKDKVKVEYIIPPNISFHMYEYKISDIKKIREADIFVYLGSGEPNVKALIKVANGKIINIGNVIPEKLLIRKFEFKEDEKHIGLKENHHHNETFHPAVWLDPRLAILIADSYYKTLVKIDPKNKDYYFNNYSDFVLKSINIYSNWSKKFKTLKYRYFISYHYLYPYLTRAFNLEYLGVIELGHGREPTIKHIFHILKLIKRKKIKYIFVSKQFFNSKYVDLLKKDGAEIIYLDPIGINKGYIKMMNDLLNNVYKGLKNNGN